MFDIGPSGLVEGTLRSKGLGSGVAETLFRDSPRIWSFGIRTGAGFGSPERVTTSVETFSGFSAFWRRLEIGPVWVPGSARWRSVDSELATLGPRLATSD